uniref:SWIM-type domain-containing protein n=2 Tax=Ciona intestinalis TaxID=7719 RepID=H2XL31_CIOIN
MKKGLHYSTKLKIKSSGEIENTSCECPAGQGPHSTCKHIAVVLCMLVEFREKGVLDLDSCTGSLQTFHQPKQKHQGGPVEASKLPGVSTTDVDDDPRPMEYRNAP